MLNLEAERACTACISNAMPSGPNALSIVRQLELPQLRAAPGLQGSAQQPHPLLAQLVALKVQLLQDRARTRAQDASDMCGTSATEAIT